MLPDPLTNFGIRRYYQNHSQFNGVYSQNRSSNSKVINLPKFKKSGVINLAEYKSIGTHWINLHVNDNNSLTYF